MPYHPTEKLQSPAIAAETTRAFVKTRGEHRPYRARQTVARTQFDVKEEANVQSQRCGPQSPRRSQGGQTREFDRARRQTGVRCLWDSGPKEGVAKSAAEAAKIATDMGFPVVMKIVSPDILHKTEAGGVIEQSPFLCSLLGSVVLLWSSACAGHPGSEPPASGCRNPGGAAGRS